MKKISALLLTFLLIVSLCACGGASKSDTGNYFGGNVSMDAMAPSAPAEKAESEYIYGVTDDSLSTNIFANSSIYNDPNAKVIRTAKMTIQSLDFDKSVVDLAALTEQYGGYYESAQIDSGSYYDQYARRSAYYIVRIPKENFVAFRDSIGNIGHIYSFSEGADDVGEEYYDTEARLETLTTKRDRLLSLLDKADKMEDIISLENALAEVQYEMDRHNTTLRKYDSLIGYSTFTINLNEVTKIVTEPGPKESFGTRLLAQLKDGLSDFADALQSFAFWLARNIITLVILAVIIFVVIKVFLHVRKKRRNRFKGEE